MDDESVRAADGRVPGQRGRQTRERLLEATEQLLASASFRDLKVVDIAREVGSSPATFYQYFPDVEAAVLQVAQATADDANGLTAPFDGVSWKGRTAVDAAYAVVDAFLDLWRRHGAVMRVVDLKITEGDAQFRRIRNEILGPPARLLRKAIAESKADGRHPESVDPHAQAGVLVAMLAHVAEHRQGDEGWGIDEDAARAAMARMVVWSVTGRRPTGD